MSSIKWRMARGEVGIMSTIFYAENDQGDTAAVKLVTDLQVGDHLDSSDTTVVDPPRPNGNFVVVGVRNSAGREYLMQYDARDYELVTSSLLI